MRHSRGRLMLVLCVLTLLGPACSGGASTPASSTSSFAPLTLPNSSSTIQSESSGTTPTTSPATERRDVRPRDILDAATISVPARCTDGAGTITVSHPIIGSGGQLLTALVDGRQVSERLQDPGSELQIDGIRCDGTAHTVLLIVTGADGGSDTRARAVLMP